MNTTVLENSSVLTGVSTPKSAAKAVAAKLIALTSSDNVKSNGKQMIMYKVELSQHAGTFVSASYTVKYKKSLTGDLITDKDGNYIPVDGTLPNIGDEVTIYAQSYIAENGEKRAWFEISRKDSSILSHADAIALLGL